ncbi:MAG: helix-turn-helix transcriptional regulator, partial [Bacteroidota bacterium]
RLPVKSVYLLQVLTNIESSQKKKYRHHYYVGNNMGNFRFPDKELLDLGEPYTEREFEIIQLIKSGFRSEQIAEKLFLSIHTINTHRKNILAKSGMKQMSDLIEDLMTRRVL